MSVDIVLSICIGLGLAAACGFRVFVPLLVMSIAANAGHLSLAPGFELIGSTPALGAFAAATILEIGAYYIPWVDNLLDSVATPAAIVAGTIVTASALGDMSPLVAWALAIIAGGGAAAVVQTATVATRVGSTTLTGGLANMVVSTVENIVSVMLAVLAVLVPVFAALVALTIVFLLVRAVAARRRATLRPA